MKATFGLIVRLAALYAALLGFGLGGISSEVLVAAWQQNAALIERCYGFLHVFWQQGRGWGALEASRRVIFGIPIHIPSFVLELLADEATFMFAGISLQVVLCIGIYHLPPTGAYIYYWLNPLLAISSIMSPLPAFEHLLVICLPFFVIDLGNVTTMRTIVPIGGHKVLQCGLALFLLVCFDYNYVLLAPFLASMMWANMEGRDGYFGDKPASLLRNRHFLVLLIVTMIILVGSLQDDHGLSRSFQETYSPSAGLFWYFEAQIFPEFRSYFVPLVAMQPSLFAMLLLPLYCLLPAASPEKQEEEEDQDDDKEEEAQQRRKLLGYHLMVIIVLLFKPAMSLVDVAFGVSLLLAYHREALQGMRFKAWILTGILVPSVLSPLLAHTWAEKGTGNANFLFFQCLALWFFCALGVVEAVKVSGSAVLSSDLSGADTTRKAKVK